MSIFNELVLIMVLQFSLIMESDTEIKECWGDLIEYIMIMFVRAAKRSPSTCIRTMFGSTGPKKGFNSSGSSDSTSSGSDSLLLRPANGLHMGKIRSDRDRLYWLYLHFEQTEDPIGLIGDALFDEFNVHIDRKEILSQLIAKGIVRDSKLESFEALLSDDDSQKTSPNDVIGDARDEIRTIVEELCKTNMRQQVIWIHDFLLKVVAVRSTDETEHHATAVHAVPFYSLGKSIEHVLRHFHQLDVCCSLFTACGTGPLQRESGDGIELHYLFKPPARTASESATRFGQTVSPRPTHFGFQNNLR